MYNIILWIKLQKSAFYKYIFSALFNDTSLTYPEMNTDFYRILPILLMYKHTTLSEYSDEISHRIMRKYFPSGKIEDQAHLNAVDVYIS